MFLDIHENILYQANEDFFQWNEDGIAEDIILSDDESEMDIFQQLLLNDQIKNKNIFTELLQRNFLKKEIDCTNLWIIKIEISWIIIKKILNGVHQLRTQDIISGSLKLKKNKKSFYFQQNMNIMILCLRQKQITWQLFHKFVGTVSQHRFTFIPYQYKYA